MILALTLLACKDQALIDENDKLKQRVGDLERANDRLEKDVAALQAQVDRAQAAKAEAAKADRAGALGWKPGQKLVATFKTSMGDIHCTLRPEQAPETVLNFVQLARGEREWTHPATDEKTTAPLYDGTIFHRVIPDFMIQGGDPLGRGTGGPGYKFADEVGDFTTFDHPGILAMANSGPDTNGSQFFITEGTPNHLNGKHTIFGDCDDLNVVKKIARVEKDRRDKPKTDVVLEKVIIETK
ncbi:MAG: peptidylprolyl isomerase [Deltaproteobacteria bacterium]|nr:peptidylprolyl isomerase [Deltaproteobacteria bacterium]